MNKKLISQQRDIYRKQFLAHGDNPDATYNQSESIQQLRFSSLLEGLDLDRETTVHDVGCGLCDLYPYILKRFPHVTYSGTEIVPEMGKLASSKFPDIQLFIRDLITDEASERYDFVVMSGVFNLPGSTPRDEWKDFSRALLRRIYEISIKGIAFNFLNASAAEYVDPAMYYENPSDVTEFCMSNFSRFVNINQAYPLFEFTTTVLKPDYVKEKYSNLAFQRFIK